jgi:SAM-dependent methyltransferase
MVETQIRFEDGAGYERMMGVWSRLAGDIFVDWVAPRAGLRWIDVGCGNGAFTELLVERCAPAEVQGIDPSEAQLAYARGRPAARVAEFRKGDAMALPFSENRFDAASMALVIFFVPDPAKGVAEMARVVSPGGIVSAYAWDVLGGGFPLEPLRAEMGAMGLPTVNPPSVGAAALDALKGLWTGAGLRDVTTREISVERTFADFDDFWSCCMLSPSLGSTIAGLPAPDRERLKGGVRARLSADAAGRITYGARANAVKGRVPG